MKLDFLLRPIAKDVIPAELLCYSILHIIDIGFAFVLSYYAYYFWPRIFLITVPIILICSLILFLLLFKINNILLISIYILFLILLLGICSQVAEQLNGKNTPPETFFIYSIELFIILFIIWIILSIFSEHMKKFIKSFRQKNWDIKGHALYSQGKYSEAIDAYDEIIRIHEKEFENHDDYAAALHNKGDALMALGRKMEAEIAFDKAKEFGYRPI